MLGASEETDGYPGWSSSGLSCSTGSSRESGGSSLSSRTSLATGRFRVLVCILTVATRTRPSWPGCTSTTRAAGQ